MARTSSSAVQAILRPGSQGGDYDDLNSPSLTPFIEAASSIVDDVVACVARKGLTAFSSAKLELIERWVAAHSYVMSDQTYASRSTAGASASFHGQTGMYLEATKYGQMAMSLDSSGCLAAVTSGSQRKTASLRWGGKRPSEQTDYADRN